MGNLRQAAGMSGERDKAKKLTLLFASAVRAFADREAMDFVLAHDEFEGWYARLFLSDARGPFSATVSAMTPKGSRTSVAGGGKEFVPAETPEEFAERVAAKCRAGIINARKRRQARGTFTRREAELRVSA